MNNIDNIVKNIKKLISEREAYEYTERNQRAVYI